MDKTIVILIGFLPDPRMTNRINLEKQIGDLHVICWDRGKNMLQMPKEDGYKLHVIHAEAGNDPVKRLIPYRKFIKQANKLLEVIEPDLIDVQGLDMLKIAASYKHNSSKKVSIIYEVADLHRLIVDKQSNPLRKLIREYLIREEKKKKKYYERLLITSNAFYDDYFFDFVDKSKVFYMPNVPDLSVFQTYTRKTIGPFTVGFIGSVRYKRQMRNLIEAAKNGGFNVLIAGYEEEPIEIENLCQGKSNIEWVGPFSFREEVASLYGKCDVIYSVYDADMKNVRVALPNKLYESVYCHLPLIVAKNTFLEKTVLEWGVGIGVNHLSAGDLVETVHRLQQDKQFYELLSTNCIKHQDEVDLSYYNKLLEKELLMLLQ